MTDDVVELGATLATQYHEELTDLTTLLVSTLFYTPNSSSDIQDIGDFVEDRPHRSYFCSELAPLPLTTPITGPLPCVCLLSLRFMEGHLEKDFNIWRADVMRKVSSIDPVHFAFSSANKIQY